MVVGVGVWAELELVEVGLRGGEGGEEVVGGLGGFGLEERGQ